MACFLKYPIFACIFLLLAGSASINAAPAGFVEGHLKIVSPKEVELADGNTLTPSAEAYAEYPLIILSQDGKKEIARVTAEENGNYHVALPPGDYILDVQGRAPRATSARNRSHSGSFRTRPSVSIWISILAFVESP